MKITEIARLAGVSTATVSRTINRVPTVNPALARRVWRVIDRVGYYPNTQARALVSGRSRIFGLLVSEIGNPFFPEIVQTFMHLGVKHNYEILLTSIENDFGQLQTAARRMIERRVEGVAILTFGPDEPLIDVFKNHKLPVFTLDSQASGGLLKTVAIDYQHGIREAVQHLAASGHQEIAFVSGPKGLKTADRRRIAFQSCIHELGLPAPRQWFLEGDHTMEAGMKAMTTLARMQRRPSAVVCSNDLTAIGVMRQAFELSLNVPRDLSVVGFDDIRLAQFIIPPLTTVQMSQAHIAEAAFAALFESVEEGHPRSSGQGTLIKTKLVLRRSTALGPYRRSRNETAAD